MPKKMWDLKNSQMLFIVDCQLGALRLGFTSNVLDDDGDSLSKTCS